MTAIENYFQRIRRAVEHIANAEAEFYVEQIFSATRANLRFKLRWPEGTLLEVSEAIEVREGLVIWLSYRYHFQSTVLILRYDNAPHHPEVTTHPEHRHQGTIVTEGKHPDLEDFFREIQQQTDLW